MYSNGSICRNLNQREEYVDQEIPDKLPGQEVSLAEVENCAVPEKNILLKPNKKGQNQSVLVKQGNKYYAVIVDSLLHHDEKSTCFNGTWYEIPEKGHPYGKVRDENHEAQGKFPFDSTLVKTILTEGFENLLCTPVNGIYPVVPEGETKKSRRFKVGFPQLYKHRFYLEMEAQVNAHFKTDKTDGK